LSKGGASKGSVLRAAKGFEGEKTAAEEAAAFGVADGAIVGAGP
jgi:hypothetical protein